MNGKFYTYVLYSKNKAKLYIGHTNNLVRRLKQHNSGFVNSTKPYRPYSLVYFEELLSKKEAVMREKELKTTMGLRYIKSLLLKEKIKNLVPS
jgi:putative endonuclease